MESLVVFLRLIPNTGVLVGVFVSWLIWVWIMTWLGRLATANAGGQVLPGPVPGPEELIDSFAAIQTIVTLMKKSSWEKGW